MNILPEIENGENKEPILDEQQAPIISTLEQRKEEEEEEEQQEQQVDKQIIEAPILPLVEAIIPISIDIDSKSVEDSIESKIVCLLFLSVQSNSLFRYRLQHQ